MDRAPFGGVMVFLIMLWLLTYLTGTVQRRPLPFLCCNGIAQRIVHAPFHTSMILESRERIAGVFFVDRELIQNHNRI